MMKFLLLAVALGGCVAAPVVSDDGPPPPSNVPRIIANALSPTMLAGSTMTTATLDATGAAAMGQTTAARKVLSYAAGCALDATQQVTFTVGGVATTLYGAMGIVPAWTTRALTATEAAWVSACVIARVNLSSAVISISARGAASGLATTSAELASYQIEEGAFWGNTFVDLGSLASYSCNGVDQAADDSYGDLPNRECAQWDGVTGSNASPCGFHYAGLCHDVCTTTTTYANCSFLGGAAQAAVVTTFLYGSPP
jgi:hypothetical protein